METQDVEYKSEFDGSQRQWLRLTKTIVSMANTAGGLIAIESLQGVKIQALDPARVDDFVNKFVAGRINNLTVEESLAVDGQLHQIVIRVPDSSSRPHIMIRDGQYEDGMGNHHWEFHPGQIWVRHSAKNSSATQDDIEGIFRGRMSLLLTQLGATVLQAPLGVWEQGASGMPFHVTDADGPGVIQVGFIYPYSAKQLGKFLDQPINWVAKMADALSWREDGIADSRYMQAIPSADGERPQNWRYSERAKSELVQLLKDRPNITPTIVIAESKV